MENQLVGSHNCIDHRPPEPICSASGRAQISYPNVHLNRVHCPICSCSWWLFIDAIRGVFKKFAAQPGRKTNFTAKRGVRDVTLLKRSLTQPLANRSSCFAQAVGCCKNVFYFRRTQRRSAGSSDYIRSVTETVARVIHEYLLATPGEHYLPYRSVKARIELFKASRENIEDDLLGGRPPVAVSQENVEEVGHLVMNEILCRTETSQRKCRYMMHQPKQFCFGISICSVCS